MITKNKISFVILLVFLFQVVLNVNYSQNIAQAATLPNITYSIVGNTNVGSEFTINVNISNVTDLYGDAFEFKFDPTLIQITGVSNGSIFSGQAPQTPNKNIDNIKGSVLLSSVLTGDNPGITASGKTLFIIKAKSLKEGKLSLNTISDNSDLSLINSVRIKLANSIGDALSYTSTKLDVAITKPVTVAKYEDTSSNVKFVGNWTKVPSTSFSGGSCFKSSTPGSYVEFSFTGTGFNWVQPVNNSRGIAKVTIDGIVQNVDTFSTTSVLQKVVLAKSGLTYGTHNVKIEVTNNKNTSSTSVTQAFDYIQAFDERPAIQPLTVGKYEENNSNIRYFGNWTKVTSTSFSGGSCLKSSTPGNYVEFAFTGTGFNWVQSVNNSRGIAKVTIDGIIQNLDTFSTTSILQKVVLAKSGLTYGTHNVKIEVTNNKNASSTSITQAFDYIKILDERPALNPLTVGKYEENNSNIRYFGNWTKVTSTSFSGGSCLKSSTPGNYVEFAFTGTGFNWVQSVNNSRGIAKVTIDGIIQNLDTFSTTSILQKVVLAKSGLTYGTHNVKIEVTNNKNASSTSITQAFDYIKILDERPALNPLTVGKYEENNSNIRYFGNWTKVTSTSFSGGSCLKSSTPGNYVEFAFTGTGFNWVQSVNNSRGIAKVTIDGIIQNVDTFSTTSILQKVVLAKSGLTYGTHNVKIEVTNNKNASSTSVTQAFDYVQVLDERFVVKPLTVGKYEENNSNIKFVGSWIKIPSTSFSGGSCIKSSTSGNYVEFSFTGTGFKWVQPVNTSRGIAKVTIDGIAQIVDTFSTTSILQKVVLAKSGLPYATHTVKIEVTNIKNISSNSITQAFDYVEIIN